MNSCPHCGEQLQENAHFCPYCMTSLDHKTVIRTHITKQRRLLTVSAVLLLLIGIVCAVCFCFPPHAATTNGSVSSTIAITRSSDNATSTFALPSGSSVVNGGQSGTKRPTATTATATPSSAVSTHISTVNSQSSTALTTTTTTTTTTTGTASSTVSYIYRAAQHGDDFSANADLRDCVVITGVQRASANGEYRIPSTIDGKTVVAIMAFAFSDPDVCHTVNTVVVPSTVKTIWNYAFNDCDQLRDIYFCGEAIYTEAQAFESERNVTLTIHCSATCHDRNFRYYQNSAANYGAEYREWNGEAR